MPAPAALIMYRPVGNPSLHNPAFVQVGEMAHTARSLGVRAIAYVPQGTTSVPDGFDAVHEGPDSFDDAPAVMRAARSVVQQHGITHVIPHYERDVVPAAMIRADNQIAGTRPDVALNFRNKNRTHAVARAAGLNVPASISPRSWSALELFATLIDFPDKPMVVKPVDGSGCEQTAILHTVQELEASWNMVRTTERGFRFEQFIPGTQYHVDTIMRDGAILFMMLSEYPVPPIDFQHTPPGTITRRHHHTAGEQDILRANGRLLQALGLRTGASHNEWFLTPDGRVVLGEAAGDRIGGGPIPWTIRHATGISLPAATVHAHLDPHYHPTIKDGPEVGGELLSTAARGAITSITNAAELRQLDGVLDASVWYQAGDMLTTPDRSTRQLGTVIVAGAHTEDIRHRMRALRRHFHVGTGRPMPMGLPELQLGAFAIP